jgi:hypothetical protein
MSMIYVKAKAGRRAYIEGRVIPEDKFVAVSDDQYVRRLIDHWEDLELQGGSAKPASASTQVPRSRTTEKGPTPPVPGGGRQQLQPPADAHAPGTGAPKPTN